MTRYEPLRWEIDLAVALGFDYVDDHRDSRPLSEYVLPDDWYAIRGNIVAVTTLVVDDNGRHVVIDDTLLTQVTKRPIPPAFITAAPIFAELLTTA